MKPLFFLFEKKSRLLIFISLFALFFAVLPRLNRVSAAPTPTRCPQPPPPTLKSPADGSSFVLHTDSADYVNLEINPVNQRCGSSPNQYKFVFVSPKGTKYEKNWKTDTLSNQTGPYKRTGSAQWWARVRYREDNGRWIESNDSDHRTFALVNPSPTPTPLPTPTPCALPKPQNVSPAGGSRYAAPISLTYRVNDLSASYQCGSNKTIFYRFEHRKITLGGNTSWAIIGGCNYSRRNYCATRYAKPGTREWRVKARITDPYYNVYRPSAYSDSTRVIIDTHPTIAPTSAPTATPAVPCPFKSQGDANCDGKIDNGEDYNIWKYEFTGKTNQRQADFDHNGRVNLVDFEIWRTHWQ